MNDSRLTIRWSRNEDGATDISVSGEVDSLPRFQRGISITRFTYPHIRY